MLKTITVNKWRAAAFALAATVAVAYISALSGGHSWLFEDFAQYLIHAHNIAELKHYAGTQCYTPVFPLLPAFSATISYFMMNAGVMKKTRKPRDVYSAPAKELFSFLEQEAPEEGLICTRKPRA